MFSSSLAMLLSPPMDTLRVLPPPASSLHASYTCINSPLELSDPFFCSSNPSLSSLDVLSSSCSPPASKKRKSHATVPDLAYQEPLVISQTVWPLNCNSSQSTAQSFPQWNNGDYSLMKASHSHLHDDDHASMMATNNCSELEDVLNFLWMEDDTVSTAQSDKSLHAASSDDQYFPSLIRDLDWDYCSNESSSNLIAESSNEGPPRKELLAELVGTFSKQDEKCHLSTKASWQKAEGVVRELESGQQRMLQDGIRASWQDAMTRTSWQDGIRASWQDGTKASWQGRGSRASWQSKAAEGVRRGSWQQAAAERVVSAGGAERGWAGPTLLDIESALALTDQSPSGPPTPSSSFKHNPISHFLDVRALLSQVDHPEYQDSESSSWRLKLQKRSSQEPKYTIKVESEEKALGDGYRWRKYGQKSIKNSPFPRSYYRCSTGKCNAKRQVEKCQQEEGLFQVTYEGIHLHHKPNMLHKFRMPSDGLDDEKEKCTSCETEKLTSSPSSSTSCSHSIPHNN